MTPTEIGIAWLAIGLFVLLPLGVLLL